ncbi:MAG: thiamine phosphate synthase [Synechococcaceae cyanobacterium SM2_3_2]|nr:thiamine phosphate synthase [Synechococcaceae cyanobacterium SM2_3_2]
MKTQAIARILDANLDRAREGLRVLEEWFRFGLESREWASDCKEMRQALARWHADPLRVARDTAGDLGGDPDYPDSTQRDSIESLLQANCSRVQEALRVLEEYGKLAETHAFWPAGIPQSCKQMRYRLYEIETQLLGLSLQKRLLGSHLYLVTSPVPNWLMAVEKALQGGVSLVQYRHKTATHRQALADLQLLRSLCDHYRALMIVNDRVDLALVTGADGIHLGQTDLPLAEARRLVGPHKLIGQSTTNAEELAAALASSADYIGAGPVYATPTKAGKEPAGFDYLRLVQEKARIPWFAIGGIDLQTLPEVVAAGAQRVAVVRCLMEAQDPIQTARLMLAQLNQGLN